MIDDRRTAGAVVAERAQRAATARIATLGPGLIAQVLRAAADLVLPATASGVQEGSLGARARSGAPLTALSDATSGQEVHLGSWGLRPATVGDLVEARATDGSRVATELRRQCALEATRMAPGIADELASSREGLAVELAHAHAAPLVDGSPGVDPAAVLCAEVAALLTIELLAAVEIHMGKAPLPVIFG